MSDRSTVIKTLVHKENPVKQIEIVLRYNIGSWNHPRGYYLGVYPIEQSGQIKTYSLFSGENDVIRKTSRYSQAAFDSLAFNLEHQIENGQSNMAKNMLQAVFTKNGLNEAEYEMA